MRGMGKILSIIADKFQLRISTYQKTKLQICMIQELI